MRGGYGKRQARVGFNGRRKVAKIAKLAGEFGEVIDAARRDGAPSWLLQSKLDSFESAIRPNMPKKTLKGMMDGLRQRAFR